MAEPPTPAARARATSALVRRLDYDRFAMALFAPAGRRDELLALFALNTEIARIPETVSEPLLGQMRLQWWREAVGELYDGKAARRHEILEALAGPIGAGRMTRASFDRLLDAREFDLMGRPPPTLSDLVAYAEGTAATLHGLGADLLGIGDAPARAAIFDIGTAWALLGLVRAIPFHARAKRQYIPADLAAETGLDRAALFELRATPALAACVARIAARAAEHLARARQRGARPTPASRALLLPATLADAYLAALARAGHDVMRAPIALNPAAKLARLWWAAARRRF
jgi:phytoene synthase